MGKYYAIGDIHGCYEHLVKALEWIEQRNGPSKVIFIGDYIDRGPKNAEVLEVVTAVPAGWEYVTLMGNHEQMFLDGYNREAEYWDRKALNQIIHGFGLEQAAKFMKGLKPYHVEDENVFAHASYFPQSSTTGHDGQLVSTGFIYPPNSGLWHRFKPGEDYQETEYHLTHGHTPKQYPETLPNRTNIDTGAVFGGALTVAEYEKGVRGPVHLELITI